ncbi:MAG: hypothetical protein AAF716_03635 [Cyanobacteria bacterium P01_D01_bin.1]
MAGSQKQEDWLGEVSKRSQESREDVRQTIQQYGIRPSPNIGKPKRLVLNRIRFSGRKAGKHSNSFHFEFDDIGYGLWGLISDGNLKGKTSVLEVVRWLLRGKASDYLQCGVKSWVGKASLDFSIDAANYSIKISQTEGGIDGKLTERSRKAEIVEICQFSSEDEFEASMSAFMMQQLSLDITSAWRKGSEVGTSGLVVSHDWAAVSGVLFIRGGNSKALFGDIVQDGLNNRLMNMYLGLPWISTLAALKVAIKKIDSQENIISEKNRVMKDTQRGQKARIEAEIRRYRADLRRMPSDEDLRKSLRATASSHTNAMNEVRQLEYELDNAKRDFNEFNRAAVEDEQALLNFREAQAARAVFKQLEPTCCPHCQISISDERRLREIEDSSCSVCGEHMTDADSADMLEEGYQNRLSASKKALEETQKTIQSLNTKIAHSQNSALRYDAEYQRLERETKNFDERYELERKISGLTFLLEDHEDVAISNEEEHITKLNKDKKIIKAAVEETKKRIVHLQKDLLQEVSKKIREYATRFGMTSITNVELTSHPQLRISKDGIETTYSKCTDGEKLRLKIASIIALVSIAEEKNIGRHPGLLLIDSPKTEEIVEKDVEQLISGLASLTESLPHLQIILATTSSKSILRHFDEDHRKYAKGNSFLW